MGAIKITFIIIIIIYSRDRGGFYSDTNYPLYSGKPDISKICFDFPLVPGDQVPGDRKIFPLSGPFSHGRQTYRVTAKAEKRNARELREILRMLYLNSQHLKKASRQRLQLLLSFIRFINPNARFKSTLIFFC